MYPSIIPCFPFMSSFPQLFVNLCLSISSVIRLWLQTQELLKYEVYAVWPEYFGLIFRHYEVHWITVLTRLLLQRTEVTMWNRALAQLRDLPDFPVVTSAWIAGRFLSRTSSTAIWPVICPDNLFYLEGNLNCNLSPLGLFF